MSNKDELKAAFKGHEAVLSAAPDPRFDTEKIWIDAAFESPSVKRIMPSEYSTNLESPLAGDLPIVTDKVLIRKYLTSTITSTDAATTWTSINNGPFFPMIFNIGAMGPSFQSKKAIFRNGGNNLIGVSRMEDIGTAVAKVLSDEHYAETANQPVYMHSAAVSERMLTDMATKLTGVKFEEINLNVEDMYQDAKAKWEKGDESGMHNFYFQMMYGEGYESSANFEKLSWNERLGLKMVSEADLEEVIRGAAKQAGVLQ